MPNKLSSVPLDDKGELTTDGLKLPSADVLAGWIEQKKPAQLKADLLKDLVRNLQSTDLIRQILSTPPATVVEARADGPRTEADKCHEQFTNNPMLPRKHRSRGPNRPVQPCLGAVLLA